MAGGYGFKSCRVGGLGFKRFGEKAAPWGQIAGLAGGRDRQYLMKTTIKRLCCNMMPHVFAFTNGEWVVHCHVCWDGTLAYPTKEKAIEVWESGKEDDGLFLDFENAKVY